MANRKGVFIGAYVPNHLKESLRRRAAAEHRRGGTSGSRGGKPAEHRVAGGHVGRHEHGHLGHDPIGEPGGGTALMRLATPGRRGNPDGVGPVLRRTRKPGSARGRPTSAGSGESDFDSERSATGSTVVCSLADLSAESGSATSESTRRP